MVRVLFGFEGCGVLEKVEVSGKLGFFLKNWASYENGVLFQFSGLFGLLNSFNLC